MRIFVQDQGLRKNIRGHIFDIPRLIIFEHNPREIGSAFHPSTIVPTYGAGAEIAASDSYSLKLGEKRAISGWKRIKPRYLQVSL